MIIKEYKHKNELKSLILSFHLFKEQTLNSINKLKILLFMLKYKYKIVWELLIKELKEF
jgi:hypothetical protein